MVRLEVGEGELAAIHPGGDRLDVGVLGWEVALAGSGEGGVRMEFTGVEGVTAERISP